MSQSLSIPSPSLVSPPVPLAAPSLPSQGCYVGVCPSLFSRLKGQGPAVASTILSALLPRIPLHVPVCLMVADWLEGYSLALFTYNSLSAGQARALRDGDQIMQYLRDALAVFPDAQRQRVRLVRWQQVVAEDASYPEETAAVQAFLRSEEGRHARRILEDMAAQFVLARKGQRTLKEERVQYAEAYLQAEVVPLMRGLRGLDHRHQPCAYLTHYHPILATQQAGSVAIRNFQELFRELVASESLSRYFKSAPLSQNQDLELEPRGDGTFATRLRPWNS